MKLFDDYKHKIIYPIKASFKLDGVFCVIKDKKGYSKNGNIFKVFDNFDYPDNTEGELYSHVLCFEDIISAIKRDVPNELTKFISFYPHNSLTKFTINSEIELYELLGRALKEKYEGIVIECNKGVLKLKPLYDTEYRIINIIEGKGKLSGKAGKIVFKGFSAGIKGDYSFLEEIWVNKDKYIGQLATVEYQNKTSLNIPRFPKVKAIRNYE